MAHITIPESVARSLYCTWAGVSQDFITVTSDDELGDLSQRLKALTAKTFVVKPDHPVGKRGKAGLIGLNLTATEVADFLAKQKGKKVGDIALTRFIVMKFIEHEAESYLSFTTEESADVVRFSEKGGIDIEENWDAVQIEEVGLTEAPTNHMAAQFLDFFRSYGFVFLEINPLAAVNGQRIPLDFKAKLDSCALFALQEKVDIFRMVAAVAEPVSPLEARISELDAVTDASLKLTLLNPSGRIWPMVAGGGASVIYYDELTALGLGEDIAFYGEYSGNPPFELTYAYASAILDGLLVSTAKNKVLLIAGANANFTDIAVTFAGILQAIEERADELKNQGVLLLVRRGGPRAEEALAAFRKLAENHGLKFYAEGVERTMTAVLERIGGLQ